MAGEHAVGTAVLFAAAPAGDGSPAAALAWERTTLLGRLLDQLGELGIRRAHVITRPEWVAPLEPHVREHHVAVELHASPSVAGDLRAVAGIARAEAGSIVLANADILTQGEALAGLLADTRVTTGILATTLRRVQRQMAFRTRGRRGRVFSAASPYHYIHQPNGTFLGVLKIGPAHRPALADVAARLADLVDGELPEGWREELGAKAGRWKLALYRRSNTGAELPESDEEHGAVEEEIELGREDVELTPADEAELARRFAAAERDVPSLLLCGVVRSDVQVGIRHLRKLFWARPLTPEDVDRAAAEIGEHDEDRALLESAVKVEDGFFTTHFVSPYSKYIARWAARRGWTPNGVTTLSVVLGFAAAAAFANGERAGLIAGALLLQAAFTFDCVDGQLARYTRTFTKFGAWLDSIFDRTKEYAVFAGLAIGAAAAGDDVWMLAGAALALQTFRHATDFSFPAALHEVMGSARQPPLEQWHDFASGVAPALEAADEAEAPPPRPPAPPTLRRRLARAWRALDRSPRGRWVKKAAAFPIGERFAAISITAALFDARVTFVVLLAWGALGTCYMGASRVRRSLARRAGLAAPGKSATERGMLEHYRDDGPIALALGRVFGGRLHAPALVLVLAGLTPLLAAIAITGDGASWAVAAAAIAWLVLAAGAASGRPLREPLRWLVPPGLRLAEYAGILWVAALAGASAVPAGFALLCAITFRHYDIVYRLRHRGETPPGWLNAAAAGWDGRLLAALAVCAAGTAPAGLYVLAGLLGVLFVGESIAGWTALGRAPAPAVYEDEEEVEE